MNTGFQFHYYQKKESNEPKLLHCPLSNLSSLEEAIFLAKVIARDFDDATHFDVADLGNKTSLFFVKKDGKWECEDVQYT